MNSIVQDTIIGTASFAIYNQNLYLYNSALDGGASNGGSVSGVSNLLLPDSGADYYTQVLDGTALYLGGIAVDSSNYVTEVQYKGAGGFSATSAINKVGTYRLKLTIGSAVDLSATVADASLEKSGGNYYFYREFTVTCETLSFTLSDFSLYEGGTRDVTLSAASASKLTSLAGTNYQTQLLYYPTQDGIARAIAADGSNSDLYHPTEAGVYIYRVVFTGDIATYGVKAGDYVDVSFEILPVPYVVRYFLDDDTEVDYRLNYSGSDPLNINPIFYDLNGNEIGDVYTDVGAKKYSVTYKFYNGTEWINNAPIAAGR